MAKTITKTWGLISNFFDVLLLMIWISLCLLLFVFKLEHIFYTNKIGLMRNDIKQKTFVLLIISSSLLLTLIESQSIDDVWTQHKFKI